MADKKISELDAITGADTAADDYFVVVDTSGQVTKKISRAELNNAIEQDVLAQVSITDLGSDLNTNGNDINFGDNDKATFGSGDLEIYHDSLNSYIVDSGTGDLIVQGGNNVFIKDGSGNNMLRTTDGAQVRLYYGNATRLDTTATGVDVTGTVVADTLSLNSSTDFGIGTISSDTNWGMYLRSDNVGGSDPANADFNFASNANENRLRIGSGGDISFYDNTGVTQGLFWDADQQSLGLGTTSPTHELTVSAANDSGIRIDAEGNNVALMLTDETTSNGFRLNYNAPNDVLSFDTTNGTGAKVSERMRILAGGGITFNGDTAAANALDDYEEGTWTATIGDDSGNTSNTSTGYYTKIGNLVRVHLNVITNISTAGLVAGDAIQISGLPYNPTNGNHAGSCYLSRTDFNGKTQLIPYAKNGTDQIRFQTTADNVNNANILVSNVLSGVADLSALVIVYHTT